MESKLEFSCVLKAELVAFDLAVFDVKVIATLDWSGCVVIPGFSAVLFDIVLILDSVAFCNFVVVVVDDDSSSSSSYSAPSSPS